MYSDTILKSPVQRASFAIIRPDLRAICGNNKTAAAVLAAFQFYTHTQMESFRVSHGPEVDIPEQALWVKVSCQRLTDFLGGGFSPRSLHTALTLLEAKGFLESLASKSRDRIKRYRLCVECVNEALARLTWQDLLITGISEGMARSMLPQQPPAKAQNPQFAKLQDGDETHFDTCKIASSNLQNCKFQFANLQDDLYLGSNKGSLEDLDPLYPPKGDKREGIQSQDSGADETQPGESECYVAEPLSITPDLTSGKPQPNSFGKADQIPNEANFAAADFQSLNSDQDLQIIPGAAAEPAAGSGELVVPKTKAIPDVALELFRREYNRCRPSTWAEALRINAERRKLFQRLWEDCDRNADYGCQLIAEALASAKISDFWSGIAGDVEKLLRKQRYQGLAEQLRARNGNADAIHGSGLNQDQIEQAKAEHERNQARAIADWMMNPVGPPPPGA